MQYCSEIRGKQSNNNCIDQNAGPRTLMLELRERSSTNAHCEHAGRVHFDTAVNVTATATTSVAHSW